MDINRLTEKAQEALRTAQSEATRLGHQQIDVEHLALALIQQQGGIVPSILTALGVQPPQVASALEGELQKTTAKLQELEAAVAA